MRLASSWREEERQRPPPFLPKTRPLTNGSRKDGGRLREVPPTLGEEWARTRHHAIIGDPSSCCTMVAAGRGRLGQIWGRKEAMALGGIECVGSRGIDWGGGGRMERRRRGVPSALYFRSNRPRSGEIKPGNALHSKELLRIDGSFLFSLI